MVVRPSPLEAGPRHGSVEAPARAESRGVVWQDVGGDSGSSSVTASASSGRQRAVRAVRQLVFGRHAGSWDSEERPRGRRRPEPQLPSNIPFVMLGTALLWFGWFGFNAGSALNATEYAGSAFLASTVAAASAMISWLALDKVVRGYVSAVGACFGVVAGLVGVTPMAGLITPMDGIIVGIATSLASYVAMRLQARTSVDDTLDVFACHGVGGVMGILLGPLLEEVRENPAASASQELGRGPAFGRAILAAICVVLYVSVVTLILFRVVDSTVGMRVSAQAERKGLDISVHKEKAQQRQLVDLALIEESDEEDEEDEEGGEGGEDEDGEGEEGHRDEGDPEGGGDDDGGRATPAAAGADADAVLPRGSSVLAGSVEGLPTANSGADGSPLSGAAGPAGGTWPQGRDRDALNADMGLASPHDQGALAVSTAPGPGLSLAKLGKLTPLSGSPQVLQAGSRDSGRRETQGLPPGAVGSPIAV